MMSSADLSPSAQRLLDYLRDYRRADHFDIQQNLGMELASALAAADELRARGRPIEVARARLTYFSYSDR